MNRKKGEAQQHPQKEQKKGDASQVELSINNDQNIEEDDDDSSP